jgi:ribonuclease P protein component
MRAPRAAATTNMADARRHTFPKSLHLRSPVEFAAVYDAKVRESRGPVLVYALPNELGFPRLGLSTSRKVGTAVRRNRIRRLLREAFRHMQHDFPRGYDLVVVVRPHEPLPLAEYQRILSGTAVKLHNAWQRRQRPAASPPRPVEGADGVNA